MQTYRLSAHPNTPPLAVSGISVTLLRLMEGTFLLRYRIHDAHKVVVPKGFMQRSEDDLWRNTCLELFLDDQHGRYREFNFAPAGDWAAFRFESYRRRIGNYEPESPPSVDFARGPKMITVGVRLPPRVLDGVRSASLCAVIEEEGGHMSYWSLVHRREEPDFHDPMSFAVRFGATGPKAEKPKEPAKVAAEGPHKLNGRDHEATQPA